MLFLPPTFFTRSLLGGLLAALLVSTDVQAQIGRWAAHMAVREATSIARSDERVWVATAGGVYAFRPETGTFERYTVVEGLHSVEAEAIAYDARRGCVWIGYGDGALDRLDVRTGTVRTFLAIERAERFASRAVNRLVVHGDSLLVATAFGLVVFDPVRLEVRNTYSRLGAFTPATPVHDVTVAPGPEGAPAFWLATGEGVAYARLDAFNLQDPGAWTSESEGLPERRGASGELQAKARAVAFFGGQIYAGGAEDLYRREPDGSYWPLGVADLDVTDLDVRALTPTAERLLGAAATGVFAVEASGEVRAFSAGAVRAPVALVAEGEGRLWIADAQRGLVDASLPPGGDRLDVVQADVRPEGPYDGTFSDLTFDAGGNLWAAGVTGTGFYRLNPGGAWTSYTRGLVPELNGSSYVTVHADPLGNVWAGSGGSGLAEVTAEGELRLYDRSNSSLQSSTTANENFIISDGIGSEADGTLWVTNKVATRPLHVRTPDGAWTALPPLSGDGLTASMRAYEELLVDRFGQKWIAVLDERDFRSGRGLVVLDTGGTPADPSDDAVRFFNGQGNAGQGLPNPRVTTLTEDRDGRVWIGTTGGLAYVTNSGFVTADPSATPIWPQWADRTMNQNPFVLRGLAINDIAPDPAGRLWVATDDGVRLLEEGTEGWGEAVHFTTQNAPLPSNRVFAVGVDQRTGRVYFATDRGLVSYGSDALRPAEEARSLTVFPNPVRVGEGEAPSIYISGLVEATELRILAPHGTVVARLSTRGGRVRWDGRGSGGEPVPSGVYLVVAVGQGGEGAAYGKVAVIR